MVNHRARLARSENINLTTIHPGIVWSETSGFYAQYRSQIEARSPIRVTGSSETLWPLVHVDDLALLYSLAVTQPTAATDYFGVTDVGCIVKTLIRHVARKVGKPARIEPISVTQAVVEKGEWAAGQARSQKVVSSKAKGDLGWIPTRVIGDVAGLG